MVRIRLGDNTVELNWENWENEVLAGRVPPEALVQFGDEPFRAAQQQEAYRSLLAKRPVDPGPPLATLFLVGVQIRIWLLQWVPSISLPEVNWLILSPVDVFENGEVWRLLTMGLLHTNFLHIAFNLIWLGFAGWTLERQFGRWHLLTIYFLSVATGSILSLFFSPWNSSLGASGGVFGLIAASVVVALTRPEFGRGWYGIVMLPYMAAMFWGGLSSDNVANWAHFGGLITGLVLAFFIDPEHAERRPGHHRRLRWVSGTALVAALGATALLGPRVQPLATPETATWYASKREQPQPPPIASSLHYRVPVGWAPGTLPSGDVGFVSRAYNVADNERAGFAVREFPLDAPVVPQQEADRWLASVQRAFPEVTAAPLVPAEVAGRQGYSTQVNIGNTRVEYRIATQGNFALVETWAVSESDRQGLQPLIDRLRSEVVWDEPLDVQRARANYEGAPKAHQTRVDWALSLATIGESKASAALWAELLQERPSDAEVWTGLLKTLRWYPDASPEPADQRSFAAGGPPTDVLWDKALQTNSSDVIVEVVVGLEKQQRTAEALGLLDHAWLVSPGDRSLKRARKSRDLSVELDPETQLPWEIVREQSRSIEEIQRLKQTPLSLASAREFGQRRQREHDALAKRTVDAIYAADVACLEGLLRLKYHRIPDDPANAWDGIQEDIRSLAKNIRPDWMPEPVAHAIRQQQTLDPLWFEDSPRWSFPIEER